jgi:hypothetical protein
MSNRRLTGPDAAKLFALMLPFGALASSAGFWLAEWMGRSDRADLIGALAPTIVVAVFIGGRDVFLPPSKLVLAATLLAYVFVAAVLIF